jgi:hypothetical protein
MNIEKIKDKSLLLKMKNAITSQIDRYRKEENVDTKKIDELLMEEMKIDIRLEELEK